MAFASDPRHKEQRKPVKSQGMSEKTTYRQFILTIAQRHGFENQTSTK